MTILETAVIRSSRPDNHEVINFTKDNLSFHVTHSEGRLLHRSIVLAVNLSYFFIFSFLWLHTHCYFIISALSAPSPWATLFYDHSLVFLLYIICLFTLIILSDYANLYLIYIHPYSAEMKQPSLTVLQTCYSSHVPNAGDIIGLGPRESNLLYNLQKVPICCKYIYYKNSKTGFPSTTILLFMSIVSNVQEEITRESLMASYPVVPIWKPCFTELSSIVSKLSFAFGDVHTIMADGPV